VTDLRKLPIPGIYNLLLEFSRCRWPELNIVHDFATDSNGTPFFGEGSARMCSFIIKDGIRYGCSTAKRTQADRFACIEINGTRLPYQLVYHFEISVGGRTSVMCSVVKRCCGDEDIPPMPWDL
jgi:hypothetical protein